jgi:hypothetical protein
MPTFGDYLAIALSPLLIAILVGSLVFFLLDVFYSGVMAGGIRWMMFWYVIAIVAVARISVERGALIANIYGLSLAFTTWLYVSSIHKGFVLGIFLLAFIWWCAHRLVKDCAKSEDFFREDPTQRVLGGILERAIPGPTPKPESNPAKNPEEKRRAGAWVVYFSIGAIPLFGIGKVLLPQDAPLLHTRSGVWLGLYLTAALMLLVSTRFLNLRFTLRQRRAKMPQQMGIRWFASGAWLIVVVGILAWLTPRPGATQQWTHTSKSINAKIGEASQWAIKWNPSGKGEGMEGQESKTLGNRIAERLAGEDGTRGNHSPPAQGNEGASSDGKNGEANTPTPTPSAPSPPGSSDSWLQWLFWATVILLICWFAYRNRAMLGALFREWWSSWLRWLKLRRLQTPHQKRRQSISSIKSKTVFFKQYTNPFTSRTSQAWKDDRLIVYTMEAFQAWVHDHKLTTQPGDTPYDQLRQWCQTFPDAYDDLCLLYRHHNHAGFGMGVHPEFKREDLKPLWNWMQQA